MLTERRNIRNACTHIHTLDILMAETQQEKPNGLIVLQNTAHQTRNIRKWQLRLINVIASHCTPAICHHLVLFYFIFLWVLNLFWKAARIIWSTIMSLISVAIISIITILQFHKFRRFCSLKSRNQENNKMVLCTVITILLLG